jgi:phage gpG-like protein
VITITVDATSVLARLTRFSGNVRGAIRRAIALDTDRVAELARGKLSGGVLHVRSGRLLASLRSSVRESPDFITGQVQAGRGVPYARIHEYGGRTKPHVIEARNALALRFTVGGKVVFARSVNHPGSLIPERSYLRSSLAELRGQIVEDLKAAVFAASR